ncbi:MAG: GNAT family N-acetyltransferase [Chloroflexota bacterium]|nr:GNAT family N-acetyltransferase [Chloroflexota bacterium]
MNHTDAPHRRAVPGPHWYLLLLGTDPTQRRTGVGSALVRHGTARADAAGLPCYLDTMNEANLAFYGRHGFEIVHEGVITTGGLRTWGLRRHPVPQRAT